MKILSLLLALVGSALAGVHGYNACYVASDAGYESLQASSVGLHIDSTRDVARDSITNRNVFRDGYLASNDWDGGVAYMRRGDSLFYTFEGTAYSMGMVVTGGKVVAKFGRGMKSQVRFLADSIVSEDTSGTTDPEISWTRDAFTADSLYSSYWTPTSNGWIDNIRCRATTDSCTCSYGRTFVYGAGTITEFYQGVAKTIHYTSIGPALGVSRPKAARMQPAKGPYQIDGALRSPAREWMPAYGR